MIELLAKHGYQPIFLGEFSSEEDINYAASLENSFPEGAPMLLKLTFTEVPSRQSLAALEVELAKTDAGRLLQNYVYLDSNDPASVYVVYTKGIALSGIIGSIMLLIGLPIILGILAWTFLVPDSVKQMVNMMIPLIMMMIIMKIMSGAIGKPKPKRIDSRYTYPTPIAPPTEQPIAPPAPQRPIEDRVATKAENIANRIESIANSIERIDSAFRRSKSEGAAKVTKVSSDIGDVARDIRKTPDTEMSEAHKAHATERLSRKQKKLVDEYEDRLTPRQRRLLERERKLVEELRTTYGGEDL